MRALRPVLVAALAATSSGIVLGLQSAGASPPVAPTVTNIYVDNLSSSLGYELASTAGGETIIIDGTNFNAVTAIDFGNVPGTDIQCFGDTTCDVVDPAAAAPSTVLVTVTAAGGTSTTYNGAGDELDYRYPTTTAAAPALLSLSPLGLHLFNLTATVTGPHGPVAGDSVQFFVQTSAANGIIPPNYETLCTATTNSKGVATCLALSDLLAIVQASPPGYYVETAPTATQLPTLVTAPVLTL